MGNASLVSWHTTHAACPFTKSRLPRKMRPLKLRGLGFGMVLVLRKPPMDRSLRAS
jgi:hypothetical protein